MNTFWDYEDIFGKAETTHLNRTMDEFLELAGSIRRRLGKQGYLLDKYISIILEAASVTLLYDAAERGFGASELHQTSIIRTIYQSLRLARGSDLFCILINPLKTNYNIACKIKIYHL